MTKGAQKTESAKTLQLKLDLFTELAERRGWKTQSDMARAFGVSNGTVRRVLKGEQSPSTDFVAGFLHAAPEAGFRRFFEIVPATESPKEVTTR